MAALVPDQVRHAVASLREHRVSADLERRDPTAATLAVRWQTPSQPMVPQWEAETAIRWAYLANVIVYRCVQIIANTLAALPFRAGLDPTKPADFNPNARLAQLLGPPPGGPVNGVLSARRLWAWTVAQRIITGRHGWEIEAATAGGEVTALWPLVAPNLKPLPTDGGAAWWRAFEYETGKGQPRRLRTDQVLYGWDPAQDDFRQPESRLQAARLDVSVAVMMGRYNVGFLRNDARPAAVVVTEAFATDEDRQAFESQFQGRYGGPDNAGKVMFAEANARGAKPSESVWVQTVGLSQRDARFVELEKASLERIAIAIGVPWSRLSASGRTFDNASEESANFWESTMLPLAADLQDEVNMQLAPRLGREVGWFDLAGVEALQPKRRFVSMLDAGQVLDRGVVSVNEVRADTGLPAVAGGDELAVAAAPAALVPARFDPAAVRPALIDHQGTDEVFDALAIEQRDSHTHTHVHGDGTIHSHPHTHRPGTPDHSHFDEIPHGHGHGTLAAVDPPLPPAPPSIEQRHTVDPDERRANTWRAANSQIGTLERRWTRALRRLFARQETAVLAALERNRGRRWVLHPDPQRGDKRALQPDDLFDQGDWETETADETAGLYEAIATIGLARVSGQFAVAFDVADQWVQDFIEARANQLAGQITETTYDAIKTALAEGVDAGEGIPDIAARIQAVFEDASTLRAVTIARTEVISAYNGSTVLAGTQLPADVAAGQEWISTLDGRTRGDHADANGQQVAIGDSFDVGGEQLAYPGDPNGSADNVVNCRCAVGLLTPDDFEGDGRTARVPIERAGALLSLIGHGVVDELELRRLARRGLPSGSLIERRA